MINMGPEEKKFLNFMLKTKRRGLIGSFGIMVPEKKEITVVAITPHP